MRLLIAMALAFSAYGAWAQSVPVRVCTHELPPYTMTDAQGQADGHATRVIDVLAKKLHWELNIRYMPWARLVEQSKAGECDVIYTVLKRPDYEEFLNFPQVTLHDRTNVLIVRRDRKIKYDGDLEKFMHRYSVGLYRDKAVDANFEVLRRAPWARVDEADSPKTNLHKLLLGRFDAAIENSVTAVYELRALNGLGDVEILSPPLNHIPAYIAFPKAGRLSEAIASFDLALREFKKSNEFKALTQRYLGTP